MIKSIFIGLNIIGILFIGFLEKSEVTVSQNLPEALSPGEEFLVEVTIDKPDIMGFAKFQVSVEEGLTIEPVETAGASFTFSDNKAKFIWMALPSAKTFTMSYRIIADQNTMGSSRVVSRFSYIYESERKNYDLTSREILLSGSGNEIASNGDEMNASGLTNETAFATVSRTVKSAGANQWKVDLDIAKSALNGFSKIEETIPEGYTAIDLKASNAVFSIEDRVVKYIWYDIPTNDVVRVTYKLLPVVAGEDRIPEISGTFSYLVKDETVKIPINGDGEMPEAPLAQKAFRDTSVALVAEVEPKEMPEEAEVEVEKISNENTSGGSIAMAAPVINTPESQPEETPMIEASASKGEDEPGEIAPTMTTTASVRPTPKVSSIDPQTGIFYRVQIAAGRSSVKPSDFTAMYEFNENLVLENIDGWFKYTTGYHKVYKEARDDRERIKGAYTKFNGPFVTAYNEGERITVQEALMITSQEWLQ
jgi:hypothetical protein